jgi:hypothetical protein
MKTNLMKPIRRMIGIALSLVLLMMAVLALPTLAGTAEQAYAEGQTWINNYGGSSFDDFESVSQTSDGGYIAAGDSWSSDGDLSGNKGRWDFAIAKFDADGNKTWMKNYGGSYDEAFYSIIQTSDGGYVAAGSSNSSDGDLSGDAGERDFVIAKFDASGNIAWIKKYGGSYHDIFYSIIQTSDGGYVAAGESMSSDGDLPGNKGYTDFVIAKFDADGNKMWMKNYGGSYDEAFNSIIQTSDGGYVAAGTSWWSSDGDLPVNKGYADFVIAKFDASGNKTWIKNYGGSEGDWLRSVVQASDGGYVAAGYSESNDGDLSANKGELDFVIAKFDTDGNKTWIKSYGGSERDYLQSIVQTSDNCYAVAGYSGSSDGDLQGNKGDDDFVIAKFDAAGNKVGIKLYGGSSSDNFYSVVQASDGGYVAAGTSASNDGDLYANKGGTDFIIAKFDANMDRYYVDISASTVTPSQTSYVYDGTAKTPAVTVTLDGKTLTQGTDYTVAYSNKVNVGTATVTVTGKGNYTGTATAQFTITKPEAVITDIAGASIALAKTSYAYDGKAKTPAVTVTLNGKTLTQGTDYTALYASNKTIGKANVTITGVGNYAGAKAASFKIVPKQVKVKKVTVGKKLVKVTWNKADAKQKISGYQIQYRIKGKAKWGKPKSISAKKLTYTIKKLKGNAYQVQIRAYKKVSGVNYYGAWSKAKTSKKVK